MTGQDLVSKAEFSRRVGISDSMVSKLTQVQLRHAVVGKKIDVNHPHVAVYLAEHHQRELKAADLSVVKAKATKKAARTPTRDIRTPLKSSKPAPIKSILQPPDNEQLAQFNDMKLSVVLKRYGTLSQFKDLLTSTKLIEEIVAKRIANAKASGDLISREHVHAHVFGAMEVILVRLIQDSPRTITARLWAAFESGETIEDCEIIVRDLQSSQIRGMKKEVTKGLESA